jgi:hypothetical protein
VELLSCRLPCGTRRQAAQPSSASTLSGCGR